MRRVAQGSVVLVTIAATSLCVLATASMRPGRFSGVAGPVGGDAKANAEGGAELRISGEVSYSGPLDLASATVTVNTVLAELAPGGGGELLRDATGSNPLPLKLQAEPGASSKSATYVPGGALRDSFRLQIRKRASERGSYEFRLRATQTGVLSAPRLCQAPAARTGLSTSFIANDGAHPPVVFTTVETWRCTGTQLRSP